MLEVVGNAARNGDLAWISLTVSRGRVVEARGEGPGVEALCAAVRGSTTLAAAAVPAEALAADALHDALGPAVTAPPDARRVAVAMSGGVDSAVALCRARDEGLRPVGVTLRLWLDPRGPSREHACCSPAEVLAARATCHRLGFPHVTLDLRPEFRRAVVAPFVRGYLGGETPNPCTRCNGGFRIGALLAFARRVGAARLATGHYARLTRHRGRLLLRSAADDVKDQSYMLATLAPSKLVRMWFPLGEQTKAETRAQARAAGLSVWDKSESQEACFLAGGDYRDFLARHGAPAQRGPVLDEAGALLGLHDGFWRFTAGQRRGLGVSARGEPLYALHTDRERNAVVVGPRAALARRRIRVGSGRVFVRVERADAKLRLRSPAAPATVVQRARGFALVLDAPAYAVAPGQTAVLYEDGVVVGAGTISSAAA